MVHAGHENALGQPIGAPLPDWRPAQAPPRSPLEGRFCRVEPLDPSRHAAELFQAYQADAEGRLWTYLSYGPFASQREFRGWLEKIVAGDDPLFHAIVKLPEETAVGVASYLRIKPELGAIEIGHINYAPALARTAAATEAMYLLMRRAFDELGYRRYEWKCDALNAASQRAALRLGFDYEGLFRQAMVYKGRNRDTAWFAILDRDWPKIRAGFEAWLAPENHDADGRQLRPLGDFVPAGRPHEAS